MRQAHRGSRARRLWLHHGSHCRRGTATEEKGRRSGISGTKCPPSCPPSLPGAPEPLWYSRYAVLLGQEPSWRSTFWGGSCKGSADVRATSGLIFTPFSTSLVSPASPEYFQALRDPIYSCEQGERRSWLLDRNTTSAEPRVYFRVWLVPGLASLQQFYL